MFQKLKTLVAVLALYATPFVVFAATGGGQGSPIKFENPLRFETLNQFLTAILEAIIAIGYPLIVLAVVYTGFLFVVAQGKPEELSKAKRALFWTLVGALIVLGAQALSLAIKGTVDDLTFIPRVELVAER